MAALVHGRLFAGTAPRFGRFVLLGHIGQGGMGVVFMAYDPQLDRDVALKLQRTEATDDRQTRRAQREAQALALLGHPNIVQVFEAGEQGTADLEGSRGVTGLPRLPLPPVLPASVARWQG